MGAGAESRPNAIAQLDMDVQALRHALDFIQTVFDCVKGKDSSHLSTQAIQDDMTGFAAIFSEQLHPTIQNRKCRRAESQVRALLNHISVVEDA